MPRLQRVLSICLCLLILSSTHAQSAKLEDINGRSFLLSELQGKWVFINYWASWCQPCLNEIPEFNRFYEENKNVVLFAVNYDGVPPDAQKKLIQQFHIRYPSLSTDPARALQLGSISVVPMTFVFNPQGQLTYRLFGGQTMADLKHMIS